jgi:membrane-anchored protein YejM (alkaline phosphatase superfamily)
MPESHAFASQSQWFTNHYSASNDNYGVFGLFYGIPNSYASSIKSQGASPLFLQTLSEQDYSFGLFSGDNFEDALYYEAIFKSKQVTQPKQEREQYDDALAVQNWQTWLTESANTPWFSYIELTTVNNFEDYQGDTGNPSSPEKALKNAYNNALSNVDRHIATVLDTLKEQELLDSTVVIITSNHGNEFNETNTNSWGSNINYSRYQLQVPFIAHWPGREAKQFAHKSSHFDVSTTLLQDLMGVSSQPQEYSSGRNLFDESERKWILAGDGREIALITESNTTVVDQFGNYKVYDGAYKRQRDAKPQLSILMQGLSELKRFYTKEQH